MEIQLRGLNKMIFNRLFKAKHLHADPKVRLQSIADLSLEKPSDKQALHELAFNDSNVDVSVAALNKLNSFPLWLKASETSELARLKKLANDRVVQELSDSSSSLLSEKEFDMFVIESNNLSLLEQILFNNKRLQENDVLALAVLLKLNKANINRRFFKDYAKQSQQKVIVKRTDDISELNKLIKVCNDQSVCDAIEEKMAHLKVAAALPLKLKQDATLVISKLLALKDSNDYEIIYENKQTLCQDFERLKANFSLLDEDTAFLLAEKYLRVNEAVEKRLSALKVVWLSANELKQTTNALADIEERYKQVKHQIDAILASIDDPSLLAQSKLLGNALADIRHNLEDAAQRPQTVSHKSKIKLLTISLDTYAGFLQQLPEARDTHSKAKLLLSELYNLDEDTTTEALVLALNELQKQWNTLLKDSLLPLPAALLADWRTTEKKYKDKLSLVQQSLKQQENKVLSKLKTVQRMIEQGSFKPALEIFKLAQKMYSGLPGKNQKGLSKLYADLDSKVTELHELQAFIAGPRKPALLEQVIRLLNESELADIPKRAQKVKALRSEWNELGKLNTEQDDALNQQFDELLEKAFQPCREYYAQQDEIRVENAQVAQLIIAELKSLSSHENMATLARALSAVNKKWKALGSLEQGERRKLYKEYQNALKPIQISLDKFYSDNLAQKQALLKKAELLNSMEDLQSAAELAKQYQQQWKGIAYSGKQSDEELWLAFRKANDLIFSNIKQERDAEASELVKIKEHFKHLASSAEEQLLKANQQKDLAELDEIIQALSQALDKVPRIHSKYEQQKFEAIKAQRGAKQSDFEKLKSQVQWQNLFDTLASWQTPDLPEGTETLAKKYQQLMQSANSHPSKLERKALTIKAEILSELPSNKSDETERKNLQLELMAARLEGSDVATLSDVLADWVSCGPLEKSDQALLKRLKKAVLA